MKRNKDAEDVLSPKKKDKTECWVLNIKAGHKVCIPRYQLLDHKKKLDANGDHLFEECEPDFVAKKFVKPYDEEKKASAIKRRNTDLTSVEIEEINNMKIEELREYAKEQEVSIQGLKTKKSILEKIEKEGKLYKEVTKEDSK